MERGREKLVPAPVIIVSMSPPGYPSAGLLPSRARFRFTRQKDCNSQKSSRLATAQLTLLSRLLQLVVAGGVDLVLAAR